MNEHVGKKRERKGERERERERERGREKNDFCRDDMKDMVGGSPGHDPTLSEGNFFLKDI